MGCSETRQLVRATRAEAYVAHKQVDLKIHTVPCEKAITILKKYSKNGSLTITTFARSLSELGLISLKDNKVDKDRLKSSKSWTKFYGCLTDYRDNTGETFNTLNVIMCFILLSNGTEQEKVALLYENLDWQCKGYVHKKMVRLFIKNFCVVSGEILPYFAEDILDESIKLREMKEMWAWAVERMPDSLTTKIIRERVSLNKEEFVKTFLDGKYKYLLNTVLLRRKMVETYAEEYEKAKKLTSVKPRLSVYYEQDPPAAAVVMMGQKLEEEKNAEQGLIEAADYNDVPVVLHK